MILATDSSVSYVGYTNNLNKRIDFHNSGKGAKFTRGRKWKLIYKRKYTSKIEAMKNEFKLKKNFKKRKSIKLNYFNNIK
tara:strand:+ start:64 stop:303 length:240 start_codon:yes stop_codon:yes gene_type:complete